MSEKKVMRLSSSGRRLGAFAIDEVFPFIVAIIACVAVGRMAGGVSVYNDFNSYGIYSDDMYNQLNTYSVQSAITITVCCILLLAYLIVQIVFYAKSQSIGKAILGMRVVNNKNGNPIGIWYMLLRELIVKKSSLICFGLGYIWILIDNKNRAWHDKILDTYVVDVEKPVQVVTELVADPIADPIAEPIAETDTTTQINTKEE